MHIFAAPPQWFPSPAFAQAFSLCTWGWLLIEIINQWLGRRHRIGKRRRGLDRGSYWAIMGQPCTPPSRSRTHSAP
jgi:hypothetical protein